MAGLEAAVAGVSDGDAADPRAGVREEVVREGRGRFTAAVE